MDIRTTPPRRALDVQDMQPESDRISEYEAAASYLARFLLIFCGVAVAVAILARVDALQIFDLMKGAM